MSNWLLTFDLLHLPPHSWRDYILDTNLCCNLVSLSTLYGVKGLLLPLITTGLASQLSPFLRGF